MRSVGVIAIGNLVSKAVGLLREVVFAAWFGTGPVAAAFRIAQTAYLLPTQALIGDSLGAGLLPLYKKLKVQDQAHARILILVASFYGLIFSVVVTTLLYWYADRVAGFIAPGATAQVISVASSLLKIMSLATPFYVISGMLSYIETSYGRYGAIAWRPMLLNIGSISGAALAVWFKYDQWLALGLLISHVIFLFWTLFQLHRIDRVWPNCIPSWSLLRLVSRKYISNLIPLLGLPVAAQLNVLIERIISSHLGTKAIPSVDYARFICDTSVQLIAVPLGILTMSIYGGASKGDEGITSHVGKITRTVLLISFPISIFFSSNSEDVVRVLFARGAFNAESVSLTSSILVWMSAALGMTITSYYLVKALNAQLRNREAFLFTVIACIVNAAINWFGWRQFGIQIVGIGVVGYAATLFVMCVWAMDMHSQIRRMILPLLLMLATQLGVILAIKQVFTIPSIKLLVAMLASLLVTGLFSVFVPILRDAAEPILVKFRPLMRIFYKK